MPSPRIEYARFSRRTARWLLPAALLALAPKCLLCALAYAGLGAALGLGGPEMCGAPLDAPAPWATSLAWLGVAGATTALGLLASRRLARLGPHRPSAEPRGPMRKRVKTRGLHRSQRNA